MAVAPAPGALSRQALRSLALVECGSVWTHAALFGMAEGHCRLLARADAATTLTPPQADITVGLRNALAAIEQITGRRLISQGAIISPETDSGDGVDGLGLIVSAGGPLRVMMLGPGIDLWGPGVRRALATLAATPSLAPGLAAADFPLFQMDGASAQAAPHALLVLAPDPADLATPQGRASFEAALAQALALDAGTGAPAIVVMGDATAQAVARQALGGREAIAVEPRSPTHPGSLAATLAHLYDQAVLGALPGMARARALASAPPLSATGALGRVARFVAQRYAMNVLSVDVGATSTIALGATAQGNLLTTLVPLAGVRLGAGAVLRQAGADAITRWLPFALPESDLRVAVAQLMLHPQSLPVTPAELALDHALAREALRLAMEQGAAPGGVGDLPQIDVIMGTGGVLANAPRLGEAALMLLDTVQPRGVTSLVLDVARIATALGCASQLDPTAAADAVDMDALVMQLGVCVSTAGAPPAGEPAVRVVLEYADGRRHTADVLAGSIELLPLGVGQQARLMLFPAPGVDVGKGPGERAQTGEPVEGGRLGVVIDARGRPLALPRDAAQRRARLSQWLAAVAR